ncbi:MAG TPA: thiamine-phosphate kinase [Azospirillaceae bacterium]|nr:thiamine-phosphate kinase [Azospirillaceae bacterium]
MSSSAFGEFGRIDRYFKPLAKDFPGALGLTDDAAVFAVPDGFELVVTTDAMVAGVHFFPEDPPEDIAAKLLRVNLSDLAAMGAEPLGYSLVTALPKGLGEGWLAAFVRGLGEDQERYRFPLIGGDSVSTPGPVMLSVTAFGTVPRGRAMTRGGARAGDRVFATGAIGDAALGLLIAQDRLEGGDEVDRAHLLGRLRRPEPRLPLAAALRGVATAAVDVSDGLVADLGHIAEVSGLTAVVEAGRVPFSPAALRVLERQPDLWSMLLTMGDDYELAFTVPADRREAVWALAAQARTPVAEIGRMESGPAGTVTVLGADGAPMTFKGRGWEHF